ncbi:MAG: hypothetical protein AAGF55_00985 [Pseudomonadota bacterium]
MCADLTYTSDGMFITLIPHTSEGEAAWSEIWRVCEGKAFAHQLPAIKSQLKAAGLKIRKGHPKTDVNYEDDELLTQLGVI